MNDREREKVARFLDDAVAAKAVYDVLLSAYLKPRQGDVQTLAASRIAIDLLQEGWRELEKVRNTTTQDEKPRQSVGL